MIVLDVNPCISGWPAHVPSLQRQGLGELPDFDLLHSLGLHLL